MLIQIIAPIIERQAVDHLVLGRNPPELTLVDTGHLSLELTLTQSASVYGIGQVDPLPTVTHNKEPTAVKTTPAACSVC